MMTYTSQIVPLLWEEGLDIMYYCSVEQEPFLEGEPFIRRHYGKDADFILKNTDTPALVESVKELLKHKLFKKHILSQKEIEAHLDAGHPIIININYRVIINSDGPFSGHAVVLLGYDDEYYYFHQSGPNNPTPNDKAKKQLFLQAWNSNGTDNDAVVIFGKRK